MVYLRILLVCAPLLVMGLSEGDPLVVETKSGRIRGFMPPNSTHATFRGVPYAAPPTGKNRWRSPQPVEPWAPAIRNATDFGAPCKQLGPAWSTMQGVAHDGSKEDCLYLNVYSPRNPVAASEKGYPTMVYFPAGQYTWGSSDDYENNAAPSFPAADDVIMVTMGYRLGIFGFLALDELRSRNEDNSTGNYGLQDMRAVLSWIKDNIHAFGGDPDNVVLWGESAGASAVTAHLVAQKSFGLYSKAIMESGAFNTWAYRKWEHANLNSKVVVAHMNCTVGGRLGHVNVSCLEQVDPLDLLHVSDDGFASHGMALSPYANALDKCMWAPTVDGVELTMPPQEALARGAPYVVTCVDFIIGSNRDEGSTFTLSQHGFGDDVPWGNTSGLPGIPADSPSNTDPYWNHPYNYIPTDINETQFDKWATELWGASPAFDLKKFKEIYPPTDNTPDRHPDPAMLDMDNVGSQRAASQSSHSSHSSQRKRAATVGGPLPGGLSTTATLGACNVTDDSQTFVFDTTDQKGGSDISSEWKGQGLDQNKHCFSRATDEYGRPSAAFIDCLANVSAQRWVFRMLNFTARKELATQLASKNHKSSAADVLASSLGGDGPSGLGQLVSADNESICLLFENKTFEHHGHTYHFEGLQLTSCKPRADNETSNVWGFTPRTAHDGKTTNSAVPTHSQTRDAVTHSESTAPVPGSLKVALFDYNPATKKSVERDLCMSVRPPPIKPKSAWWWTASRSIGDFLLSCPTRRAARLKQVDRKQNTFMYYFNHTPYYSANQKDTPLYGAFHGSEVPFVWGDGFELVGEGEMALSESMVTYWTNFAWSGNPNYRLDKHGDKQFVQPVEWPAYECRNPKLGCADRNIIFDVKVDGHATLEMDHLKDRLCNFWDKVAAANNTKRSTH